MHPFPVFLEACFAPGAVRVLKTALDTVELLGLPRNEADVLEWVRAGGVEDPEHWNTEPWNNNQDPQWKSHPSLDNVVWVDAFTFWSGPDEGYLAYLRPATGIWLLKSLKPR